MRFVSDSAQESNVAPGIHALIVGVSNYPNLPRTGELWHPRTTGVIDFDLEQLSSAALSAFKMYKWIEDQNRRSKLPGPLVSCRVLLSPSPEEIEREGELAAFTAPANRATLQNFETYIKEWRVAASTSRENMTLFYFAGHGLHRSARDVILLLEDFADGSGGPLAKTVSTKTIYDGMAPSSEHRNIAGTQLYFVDACRTDPSDELHKQFYDWYPHGLWTTYRSETDYRTLPIFHAALPGGRAYGIRGQQTIFNQALLTCLEGVAGRSKDGTWLVSVYSLNDWLQELIKELNEMNATDQECTLEGQVRDETIVLLDGPPRVDVHLEIDPPVRDKRARVVVFGPDNKPFLELNPFDPDPYMDNWPAGTYRVEAAFIPPDARYRGCSIKRFIPPWPRTTRWELEVKV